MRDSNTRRFDRFWVGILPSSESPKAILFLCVANSARSQIAEAIARSLAPQGTRVFSAGSQPASTVHPLAARVLEEIGISIGDQRPKSIDEIDLDAIDAVYTLCAEEVCPVFPREVRKAHWALPDPAAVDADPDACLDAFRSVRDELRTRIGRLFASGPA
jgi:arsenate reductase